MSYGISLSAMEEAVEATSTVFAVVVDQEPQQHVYSSTAVRAALVFCVAFIFVGVAGNGLTIAAVVRHRQLRALPTSVFVVSLCITDLLFCGLLLPITAVRFAHQQWVLGDVLCRLFPFLFYLNVAASLFTMCCLTMNRYALIAHFCSYEKLFSRCNIGLMIGGCWLLPLLLLMPSMLEVWGRFGYDARSFSCTVLPDAVTESSPKKLFFIIGFFVPCTVIIGAYARIIQLVRRSRRTVEKHTPVRRCSVQQQQATVGEKALTSIVLIIFGAFLLAYLPLMLVNVFDSDNALSDVHVAASVFAWSASVVNPFIYGLMSSRYRQAYKSLLPRCLFGKSGVNGGQNNNHTCTRSSSDGRSQTNGGGNSLLLTSFHAPMFPRSHSLLATGVD